MRLTIVKDDNVVIKDGRLINIDLSGLLSDDFHALQWNNNSGHIEYKSRNKPNEEITDLTPFQAILDLYEQEKQRIDEEIAEQERKRLEYEEGIEYLRDLRNQKIEEVSWYFERHMMQKSMNIPTTLTEEQFLEYLNYVQQLRDITNVYQSVKTVVWPQKPSFMID